VVRDGKSKTIKVKIGEQPKDVASIGEESSGVQGEGDNKALVGLEVRNLSAEIAERLGLPPDSKGVVITDIDPASKAAEAGLRVGDIINEINREPVKNIEDFKRIVAGLGKDENPLLLVKRREGKFFVVVKS
jgi:serine protease Do